MARKRYEERDISRVKNRKQGKQKEGEVEVERGEGQVV